MIVFYRAHKAILICFMLMFFGEHSYAQKAIDYTLTVSNTTVQKNDKLFGTNLNWIDYGDGIYHFDEIHPQILMNIKEIGIRSLRYPGGTLSETYEWRNGIGDVSLRKTGPNYLGSHQKIVFGTDEFLQLCEENEITPVITLGYKDGSDHEDNLSWMDYCYTTTHIPENSPINSTRPSIYWEIGNEIYLSGNSISSAQKYINYCNSLAIEAKRRHPDAVIGVCITGIPSPWDSVVISQANSMIDFYSYHAYFVFDTSQTVHISKGIRKIRSELSQIEQLSKDFQNVKKIVVSEFNILPSNGRSFVNIRPSIEQAVYYIGCLRLFHEFNVHMAMKWCLSSYGSLFFADIQNAHSNRRTYTFTYYLQKYLQHQQYSFVNNSTHSNESERYNDLVLSDSSQQRFSLCLSNTNIYDSVSYKIIFPFDLRNSNITSDILGNNISHQKHMINFASENNEITMTIPPRSIIFLKTEKYQSE